MSRSVLLTIIICTVTRPSLTDDQCWHFNSVFKKCESSTCFDDWFCCPSGCTFTQCANDKFPGAGTTRSGAYCDPKDDPKEDPKGDSTSHSSSDFVGDKWWFWVLMVIVILAFLGGFIALVIFASRRGYGGAFLMGAFSGGTWGYGRRRRHHYGSDLATAVAVGAMVDALTTPPIVTYNSPYYQQTPMVYPMAAGPVQIGAVPYPTQVAPVPSTMVAVSAPPPYAAAPPVATNTPAAGAQQQPKV